MRMKLAHNWRKNRCDHDPVRANRRRIIIEASVSWTADSLSHALGMPVNAAYGCASRAGVHNQAAPSTPPLHTICVVVLVALSLAPLVVAHNILSTPIAHATRLHRLRRLRRLRRRWVQSVSDELRLVMDGVVGSWWLGWMHAGTRRRHHSSRQAIRQLLETMSHVGAICGRHLLVQRAVLLQLLHLCFDPVSLPELPAEH